MRWIRLFSDARARPGEGAYRRATRLVVAAASQAGRPLVLGLGAAMLASALALVPPLLLAKVVDGAMATRDMRAVIGIFVLLSAVALMDGALLLLRRRIVVRTQTALRLRFAQSQLAHMFACRWHDSRRATTGR